jgi:hypothetical protein
MEVGQENGDEVGTEVGTGIGLVMVGTGSVIELEMVLELV